MNEVLEFRIKNAMAYCDGQDYDDTDYTHEDIVDFLMDGCCVKQNKFVEKHRWYSVMEQVSEVVGENETFYVSIDYAVCDGDEGPSYEFGQNIYEVYPKEKTVTVFSEDED